MFGVLLVAMFGVLLLVGGRSFQEAPPLPERVVAADAASRVVLFTSRDIHDGRDIWRRLGGMELGSVWGHGSYLAPDLTADMLHREAMAMLDADGDFASLTEPERAARIAAFATRQRVNTYDPETGEIAISPARARALETVTAHYMALFGGPGDGPEAERLRIDFAIPNQPLGSEPEVAIRKLVAWWWWTSWAAGTLRPGDSVTYTNNWPHEPLIDNRPSSATFIWTFVSIVLLIAAVGALCWFFLREREEWQKDSEPIAGYPDNNPLAGTAATLSMRAVVKYIWVVALLLGLQITLGVVTAHYAVEGHDFYGIPLSEIAPYALTRTWHVQLAILWIATAWLGAGLYLAPRIAGFDPPFQRFGVNALWADRSPQARPVPGRARAAGPPNPPSRCRCARPQRPRPTGGHARQADPSPHQCLRKSVPGLSFPKTLFADLHDSHHPGVDEIFGRHRGVDPSGDALILILIFPSSAIGGPYGVLDQARFPSQRTRDVRPGCPCAQRSG